jgi:hypothetical protein
MTPEDDSGKAGVELQPAPQFGRFTGANLRQRPLLVQQALYKQLEPPAAGFASEQPRWNNAGIVKHQQIAGPQQFRQIAEALVSDLAGRAIQGQ